MNEYGLMYYKYFEINKQLYRIEYKEANDIENIENIYTVLGI